MPGKIRFASSLSLLAAGSNHASARWLELLSAIERRRSISAAAREVGMSYKAAWNAVDHLNNLTAKALVQTATGGRGGGGTQLTPTGRKLLDTFHLHQAEHTAFMARMNAQGGDIREQLHLIGRISMLSSARNQMWGKVVRLRRGTVNDEVELLLPGGDHIVAVITHESVENLDIKRGKNLLAMIKASWVMIAVGPERELMLSARNQLWGKVSRLVRGAVNTEVVLDLAGGHALAATITNQAARQLRLRRGMQACGVFKASSVILAAEP